MHPSGKIIGNNFPCLKQEALSPLDVRYFNGTDNLGKGYSLTFEFTFNIRTFEHLNILTFEGRWHIQPNTITTTILPGGKITNSHQAARGYPYNG